MATRPKATDTGKKLFVGPRFRRIRQQLGLSQTQIAEGLGMSPSYINLIERNQRPVTAQLLLRLAETYDLDLRDLATADEDRFFAELNEIFSDPLFRQIDLPKQELRDLAELAPGVTHALQRLYAAYTEARRGETMVAAQIADRTDGARFEANPIERVRDLVEANRNYFPDLEQAAEALRDEINVTTPGSVCGAGNALARKALRDRAHHAGRRDARDAAALGPASPADPDLRTGRSAGPRVPARLPDRACRMRAVAGRDRRAHRRARRHQPPPLPHHAGELFCRRRDDAVSAVSRRRRKPRLRRARAGPALQRELRAGLPSPDHAAAADRARRAVLHAARRQCRQRVEAVFIRHVRVLEIRRHLPALERALDLRHAGPAA